MIPLASILDVAHNVGYPALFLLVMAESGGIPVPGETALITAGVLASTGRLEIVAVILVAATAAIIGDNIGYVIGRRGGRLLLERPGPFLARRRQVLVVGEPFFDRHGPKAVFFGRWIVLLRTWASWLAGATYMRWRSFVLWNALGGLSWATTIGLLAYFLSNSVKSAVSSFGVFALVGVLLAGLGVLLTHRLHRRFAPSVPSAQDVSHGSGDADGGDALTAGVPQGDRVPSPPASEP